MTLQEFFDLFSASPSLVLYFVLTPPAIVLLMGTMPEHKRPLPPVNYLYSFLLYATTIPGVFVLTLNIYLFLFERQSILDMNLLTHVLPVFTMILTILMVRRQINLDLVPGFDRLSGLITMLTVLMVILWVVDRTSFRVFSFLPFSLAILLFVGLIFLWRMGWSRFSSGERK